MILQCVRMFIVVACVTLGACSKAPPELRIGVAMPLSGALGEEGRNLLAAAQLAADQIRARGPGLTSAPLSISIVPADDRGDDAWAPAAARSLVSQGVTSVIGHLTSGASIAAAPVYANAHIVQLSMATHPRYTQLGLATTFRLVANDRVQAQALGRYGASEFKGSAFAIIDDGSVYGRALADGVFAEIDGAQERVVLRKTYDANASQFPELLAALDGANAPKVIVTTMELPQVNALVRSLVATKHTDVVLIGGDTLKTGDVPAEAAQLRAYLCTSPVTDRREFAGTGEEFAHLYTRKYGHAPVDAAHYVYDAVFLLAQAAALGGSTASDALSTELRRIDPNLPVTGSMRFREDGELRFAVVSLYAADKGVWRLIARGSVW